MKINIYLAAGIAGMFFGVPHGEINAQDAIYVNSVKGQTVTIDVQPSFIYLNDYGFSVSVKSPHDIIFYENLYYLFRDGAWYRSAFARGPWISIIEDGVPYTIRSRRWEDIKRSRDIEYTRHNQILWEDSDRSHNRHQINRREQQDRLIPKGQWNNLEQREHSDRK